MTTDSLARWEHGKRMAKKTKVRPWTKDHVRTLKTLAREKTKTTAIARKLNQSVGAMDAREEDTQPRDRTVIVKLSCWEEFVQKLPSLTIRAVVFGTRCGFEV